MSEEKVKYELKNLPGGLFKAMEKISEDKDGRYTLNCLHTEDNELAVADGRILGVVEFGDIDFGVGNFILDGTNVRKRSTVTMVRDGDELKIKETSKSKNRINSYPEKKEGQFPDYEEVIPEKRDPDVILYRESLEKILNLMETAGHDAIELQLEGEKSPTRIDSHEDGKGLQITAVVSPIIDDE